MKVASKIGSETLRFDSNVSPKSHTVCRGFITYKVASRPVYYSSNVEVYFSQRSQLISLSDVSVRTNIIELDAHVV